MNVNKRSFKNEEVVLDFNKFENCTFEDCELVFHGYGAVGLKSNTFVRCRWSFSGPAATTISFMTAIYQQGDGGRDLIEKTLENIRSGRT